MSDVMGRYRCAVISRQGPRFYARIPNPNRERFGLPASYEGRYADTVEDLYAAIDRYLDEEV